MQFTRNRLGRVGLMRMTFYARVRSDKKVIYNKVPDSLLSPLDWVVQKSVPELSVA